MLGKQMSMLTFFLFHCLTLQAVSLLKNISLKTCNSQFQTLPALMMLPGKPFQWITAEECQPCLTFWGQT